MTEDASISRRGSEGRSHQRVYALLAAGLTVLASLALWGKQLRDADAGPQDFGTAGWKNTPPPDWQERIASLRPRVNPENPSAKPLNAIEEASASLADALEEVDLPLLESDDPSWPTRVDRLTKLLAGPARPGDSVPASPTGAGELEARIAAKVLRYKQDRQQRTAQAIEQATLRVKQARQPELRTATLGVRDAQDQIEQLRTKLGREGAGNTRLQEEAFRAAALARDIAEVRSLLSPFITPGHYQPPEGGGHKYEHTIDAKPVSLKRLQRAGALDPTNAGRTYLLRFGGSRQVRGNRRPLGSFPEYWGSGSPINERNMPRVKRAQELLREHGQALVEAKMLTE